MTRGRWAVGVWLLVLAAALLQIARTPFSADLSAFLPASPDRGQRLLIEQLRSGVAARTLLIGIEGGDAVQRAAASRALAAALRGGGLFEQVHNGDLDAWAGVGQWIVEHRYLLSPAVRPERYSAAGLRDAIDETVSLLGTPAGRAVEPLLDRDPSGEVQRIAETLIPSGGPRSEHGVWVSRQAPRAVLLAITRAAGADLDGQAAAIAAVRKAFAAPAAAPGLTLQLSGTPVFAVDSRAAIEGEAIWLAATGAVVISTLLLIAFASPRALLASALPVASGVVAGIAAVGLAFGTVHGMTLGFGAALIGEAVDYAIYYLIQARRAGWRHWQVHGWPTVRLGVATSVCGFLALAFSGFPGLAQLGVFSMCGLIAAALTTRWVLPVWMPDGASGLGLRQRLAQAAGGALAWLPATRWAWLVLGAAAAAVVAGRGEVWRADLTALSPVSPAALALDARLRADLGNGDGGTLVVVQARDAETALQRAEAAGERLEALVTQGAIGGFDSVARLLPSQATQRRRQAALPPPGPLQAALREATREGALPYARLAPFLAEVERARHQPLLTADAAATGAVAPIVSALWQRGADGSWLALLPLQPAAGKPLDAAAIAGALRGLPETQALDVKHELDRLYAHYLGEAKTQALLGAGGVVLLMALALRSPRRVLAVSQPLLLAVLITLAGLVLLDVALGILHLVGLLLVVAVGSNYALFFDRGREALNDADTLASLLLANLTTVLSFGLIALSSIPALKAIGVVVAPGALLALVLAAAFTGAGPPRPSGPVPPGGSVPDRESPILG